MTRRWLSLLLAPVPFVPGCAQDPDNPTFGADPLVPTMAFNTKTFIIGKPDTISVTATSSLEQDAVFRYDTDCQVVVTIRAERDRSIPAGRLDDRASRGDVFPLGGHQRSQLLDAGCGGGGRPRRAAEAARAAAPPRAASPFAQP